MNILEMSTAVLTGHRLIMLVKNVILINSGTINVSFQIQNRKWLYNKRSLKLPPCILWYFNHLMFSLSSWTSFHFAHWSNYNFFFTWVLIPPPRFYHLVTIYSLLSFHRRHFSDPWVLLWFLRTVLPLILYYIMLCLSLHLFWI